MSRAASRERETAETQIKLSLDLDGGEASADTGVGFLDHMLDLLARHGRLGLRVGFRAQTLATVALVGLLGALSVLAMLHAPDLGARLFPMSAPIGGTLLIGGWLVIASSALACPRL